MQCPNCFSEIEVIGICPHCGYNPADDEGRFPHALKPGTILNGKYIAGRVLGQGGFGITYIAQDFETKELVAIKEYLPEEFATRIPGSYSVQAYSGDLEDGFEYGKERFVAEAKTLAAFRGNENIVRVERYFEENGTAYLVMEYVNGIGLDKYMKAHDGRISTDLANKYLLPMMDALDWVHSKGVIHRDIAPDNILITDKGLAKLIDFGAARYSVGTKSRSLDVILKHGFAPFEQYSRHGRQGPYTDVYALAATYYYAITGHIPPDSIDRINGDEIDMPSRIGADIWPEAEKTLMKGLAITATERWQTMGEFRAAFDKANKAEEARREAARKAEEVRREKERKAEEQRIAKEKKAEAKRIAEEQKKKAKAEKAAAKVAEENTATPDNATTTEKHAKPHRKAAIVIPSSIAIATIVIISALFIDFRIVNSLSDKGEFQKASNAVLFPQFINKQDDKLIEYIEAGKLLSNDNNYSEAYKAFSELADYKNAPEFQKESLYQFGIEQLEKEKDYANAGSIFSELESYKNSVELLNESMYQLGNKQYELGQYKEAKSSLQKIKKYKDSKQIIEKCDYYLPARVIITSGNSKDDVIEILTKQGFSNINLIEIYSNKVEAGEIVFSNIKAKETEKDAPITIIASKGKGPELKSTTYNPGGNPIGEEWDIPIGTNTDLLKTGEFEVTSVKGQILDSGYIKATIRFKMSRAGMRTDVFTPPNGRVFMLSGPNTSGEEQEVIYYFAPDYYVNADNGESITFMFWVSDNDRAFAFVNNLREE